MSQNQTDLTYHLGLRSDVGKQRTNNEDAAAIFNLMGAQAAFVVCDGMGGMRSGEIAALEAVRTIQHQLTEQFEYGVSDPNKTLGDAFHRANDAVNALDATPTALPEPRLSRESAPPPGSLEKRSLMGTTCVAGVVRDETLYLAHAGDSRAYRMRRGHMTRLTEDHSFVAERVRAGDMTEAEARTSRFRNIVTRGIGIEATVEPEFRREPIEPGDLLLVCSDGLTTMLDDPEIAAILNRPNIRKSPPDIIAATLVDAANKAGGQDNITVLIIKVSGENSPLENADIIDLDASDDQKTKKPAIFLWVLAGVLLTIVVLMALFTFVSPVRQKIGQLAMPPGQTLMAPSISTGTPSPESTKTNEKIDYRLLEYDSPTNFASDYLARGDLLTYSPGRGLIFVTGSTGKVLRLDSKGKAYPTSTSLEISKFPDEFKPTHVFITADPQGNFYISYTSKNVVVKRSPEGKILATIQGFKSPEAIALDELGNIYVIDFNQIMVCKAHLKKPESTPSVPSSLRARG